MCKVLPFGGELSCQANTNSMLPTPATTRCVASPGSKALATTLVALAKRSIHASRIMYRVFALAMQQALIKRPALRQMTTPPSSLPQWILPPSALARPFTPGGRCRLGELIISSIEKTIGSVKLRYSSYTSAPLATIQPMLVRTLSLKNILIYLCSKSLCLMNVRSMIVI